MIFECLTCPNVIFLCSYGIFLWFHEKFDWTVQVLSTYWLAMSQNQYTSSHNVPKWHMAATNTLDCSVFTRFLAIGWLLAGYVPKSIDFLVIGWLCPQINRLQDIVIYYYGYWLAIGWLCPKISWLCPLINTFQDMAVGHFRFESKSDWTKWK